MVEPYAVPKCCREAAYLIIWLPQGVPQDKYAKARREHRDLHASPPTCGPAHAGWCTLIETRTTGLHNEYVNVVACPFCGASLED